jgi:hypothetical protein
VGGGRKYTTSFIKSGLFGNRWAAVNYLCVAPDVQAIAQVDSCTFTCPTEDSVISPAALVRSPLSAASLAVFVVMTFYFGLFNAPVFEHALLTQLALVASWVSARDIPGLRKFIAYRATWPIRWIMPHLLLAVIVWRDDQMATEPVAAMQLAGAH